MLTAIGRASVQRVLVQGSALAARRATVAAPAFVKATAPASRAFTTSLRVRLPAAAGKKATKTKKDTTTKKAATKPKAAAAKKKAAPKPKAVKKVKKEVTPEAKLKKDIKNLKAIALLDEPKKLPENSWTVFTAENVKAGTTADNQIVDVAREYRSLSESQLLVCSA